MKRRLSRQLNLDASAKQSVPAEIIFEKLSLLLLLLLISVKSKFFLKSYWMKTSIELNCEMAIHP